MAAPSGVMHCGENTLAVIVQPAGGFGGSRRVFPTRSLKLPAISAVVGSSSVWGFWPIRIRFHSCPTKKNNFSWTMGPPKFHPKSLKRSGGFNCLSVVPGGGLDLLAAFNASVAYV